MMREVLGGCFASHFSDYNETERGLCAIVRGERALFSIFPPVLFIFHQHVCLDSRFPLTHNYRPFPGTKEEQCRFSFAVTPLLLCQEELQHRICTQTLTSDVGCHLIRFRLHFLWFPEHWSETEVSCSGLIINEANIRPSVEHLLARIIFKRTFIILEWVNGSSEGDWRQWAALIMRV